MLFEVNARILVNVSDLYAPHHEAAVYDGLNEMFRSAAKDGNDGSAFIVDWEHTAVERADLMLDTYEEGDF